MKDRTFCYGLEVEGVGTSDVESFRSYVRRLSMLHRVKPAALLSTLASMFGWTGTMFDMSAALEGTCTLTDSAIGTQLRRLVEKGTGRDMSRCSLGQLGVLVADQHLVWTKGMRYCPLCVRGDKPHGRLVWDIACVKACPHHGVRLRHSMTCGAPKEERLRPFERPSLPNVCTHCGSIGFTCITHEAEPATDSEVIVAREVGRLLSVDGAVVGTWTAATLRAGIRAVVNQRFGGSVVRASRESTLSRSSVCTWASGKGRPSLSGLVQMCMTAKVDMAAMFGGVCRLTAPDLVALPGAPAADFPRSRCDRDLADAPSAVVHVGVDAVIYEMTRSGASGADGGDEGGVGRQSEHSVDEELRGSEESARAIAAEDGVGTLTRGSEVAPSTERDLVGMQPLQPPAQRVFVRPYKRTPINFDGAAELMAAIASKQVPSLVQFAAMHRLDPRTVTDRWPELARNLVQRSASQRQQQWMESHHLTELAYEAAVDECEKRGVPVTAKYVQMLSRRPAFQSNARRRALLLKVIERRAVAQRREE